MPLRKTLPVTLALVAAVCALAVPKALANPHLVTIMQDNNAINAHPLAALAKMRSMGVTMVKYAVYWKYVSPDPNATRAPAGATNPAIYYPEFGQLDQIDQDAAKVGIKLGFMVTAPAPRWASGNVQGTLRPSDAAFRTFMAALGARYSGRVPGLPAVRWWSIWNEPNYIPNLAPQTVGSTYVAADLYRGLLGAAWSGLEATGHRPGPDTILFGEVAPRGIAGPRSGNGAGIKPVQFIASLYCETTAGRRLTGRVAASNGCGANPTAFRRANPALFDASGFADHPYAQGTAPDVPTYDCLHHGWTFCENPRTKKGDPLWTDLGELAHLTTILDRSQHTYGSGRKLPIWNTEYGYWTAPPGHNPCRGAAPSNCDLSLSTAALYLNWAEYISYMNPRLMSIAQYQLYDPISGGWTDGLLTNSGAPRLTYDAYEMPLFMPTTSVAHPANLKIWGGVRPAAFNAGAYHIAPVVEIQFKGTKGGYRTVRTLRVSGPAGYFSTFVHFTGSGSVRLAYRTGRTTLFSRAQAISVR